MIAFCSVVQTPTDIVLCWKYRLWVDFKIESVLFLIIISASQERKKVIIFDSYVMKKWGQLHLTLNDSKSENGRKHKNCSKQ